MQSHSHGRDRSFAECAGKAFTPGEDRPSKGPEPTDMEELMEFLEAPLRLGSSVGNCMALRERLLPLLRRLCMLPAGECRAVPHLLAPLSLLVSSSILLFENCTAG